MSPQLTHMAPSWQTLVDYERKLRCTECASDLHLWLAFRVLALPRIVDDDYSRMFVVHQLPPSNPNDDRAFCVVGDGSDHCDVFLEYRHPHRHAFRVVLASDTPYHRVAPHLADLARIVKYALLHRHDFNLGDCIADKVGAITSHDQQRLARDVWGAKSLTHNVADLVRRMRCDDGPLPSISDLERIIELMGGVTYVQYMLGRSIEFRVPQPTTRTPTLWVIVGLPATGKSYWVDAQTQMGLPYRTVVSVDRIIHDWAMQRGLTYDQVFASSLPEARRLADQQFRQAIESNRDVFHDATNVRPSHRVKYILSYVPHFYTKIAVFFPRPDQDVWELLLRARPGKTIPQDALDRMMLDLRIPTAHELALTPSSSCHQSNWRRSCWGLKARRARCCNTFSPTSRPAKAVCQLSRLFGGHTDSPRRAKKELSRVAPISAPRQDAERAAARLASYQDCRAAVHVVEHARQNARIEANN